MTVNELDNFFAKALKNAKDNSGMTISTIAEQMHKDDKTVSNWLKGKGTPSASNLIHLFSVMHQPLWQCALISMFPHLSHIKDKSTAATKRDEMVYYLQSVALDSEIEKLHFLTFGPHGSNWYPQLEEWVALDHLPMRDKVYVAKVIENAYEIADARSELVAGDCVKPDMDVFVDAIEHGRIATISGRNAYNISKNKEY